VTIRRWKNFDNTFSRFDAIPECHGRTDRRTELPYQYRALHSWINAYGRKKLTELKLSTEESLSMKRSFLYLSIRSQVKYKSSMIWSCVCYWTAVSMEFGFRCRITQNGMFCTRGECWLPSYLFCDGFPQCSDQTDEDQTFCREFSTKLITSLWQIFLS